MATILEVIQSHAFGGLERVALGDEKLLQSLGHEVLLASSGNAILKEKSSFVSPYLRNHFDVRSLALPKSDFLYAHQTGLVGSLSFYRAMKFSQKFILHSHLMIEHCKRDWYHRLIYKSVDVVLAISPEHVENLQNNLPLGTKIQEIPLALDESFFTSQYPETEDYFLAVGRIDPHKGQDLVCEIAHAHPGQKFFIVGEATPGEENYARNLKSNAPPNVSFLGAKPVGELIPLMAKAKAVLMLSRRETLGLVALESLALGTPLFYLQGGGSRRLQEVGGIAISRDALREIPSIAPRWDLAQRQERSQLVALKYSKAARLKAFSRIFAL